VLLWKLGYRNLWRNRRRTLLTMTAMAFSTGIVILTFSVYEGMFRDMIDSSTTMYYGHVQITAKGYFNNPRLELTIPDDDLRERIIPDPRVKGMSGRVQGFALLSYGAGDSSRSQPAELLGIDPEKENQVSTLSRKVLAGRFITSPFAKEMVLGKGLARSLGAKTGGEIVAMGQDMYGSVAADIFHVAGIIDTGDPVRDASLALTGLGALQTMLDMNGKLNEWAITLESPTEAIGFASGWQRSLPGIDVLPWNSFLSQLNDIINIKKISKFIFAVIFYFAVILVTGNTIHMSILERMREFAVMGAIGLKPLRLASLVITEGMIMSGIAAVAGEILGLLPTLYILNHPIDLSSFMTSISIADSTIQPRIRTALAIDNLIIPVLLIFVFGVIVSLFPARRLKKMRPVNVLREV
jgi:ABC-type lipoprotein release transport system permease subunit